jgi:TP901-1 family phage major tail protein
VAMNGTDVLIWVDGNMVGSQRDVTIDEATGEVDVSSKDQREMRVLPGRYDSSLSLEALYVPTNTAYLALQAAMRNGTFVEVVVLEDGVVTESADAIVTSLSRAAPDQDAATVSIGLRIDGAWVSGS